MNVYQNQINKIFFPTFLNYLNKIIIFYWLFKVNIHFKALFNIILIRVLTLNSTALLKIYHHRSIRFFLQINMETFFKKI